MNRAPDGAVIEGPASDDEIGGAVGGAERENEGRGGEGARPRRNRTPECQRRPRSLKIQTLYMN